jgi:hypothetical protein
MKCPYCGRDIHDMSDHLEVNRSCFDIHNERAKARIDETLRKIEE